jgi:hypothetical protein
MRRIALLVLGFALMAAPTSASASSDHGVRTLCPRADVASPRYGARVRRLDAPPSVNYSVPSVPVRIYGPVGRDESGTRSVGLMMEAWWVRGRAGPNTVPGRGKLVATQDVAGLCRFGMTFRVPDQPIGRYTIVVFSYDWQGYGLFGRLPFFISGC